VIAAILFGCTVTGLLSIGFGSFVWWSGRRDRAHILWSITCFTIAIWSVGYALKVSSVTHSDAMFWARVLHVGAILIPIVFFHFVCTVFGLRHKALLIAGYVAAAAFEGVNLLGEMFIVTPKPPIAYYVTRTPLYDLFTLYFFAASIIPNVVLFRQIRNGDPAKRMQALYMFTGMSIGFAGGFTTFPFAYGIPIPPYGVFAVIVYIPMISYAIFRHQLLDIRVVIQRTVVYSAVTAVLTATYVMLLYLITRVLAGWVGQPSAYSSAIAAGVIAILFHPLRTRLQQALDRRFPRESLDQDLLREATSGFAHEIKRPLSKISLPAQLAIQDIERWRPDAESAEALLARVSDRLRFIVRESEDAGHMVEALRSLAGTKGASKEDVELGELVSGIVQSFERQSRSADVQIELHVPPAGVLVSVQRKQLEIGLTNLLKNAIEAVEAQPEGRRTVRVAVTPKQNEALVSIQDSGPGIQSVDQQRLFTPYFTTKQGKGMGVGLWLAREIVRSHGGSVSCESDIDQGTVFTVRLPLANAGTSR
jgi:signal transduction histidine kinase